MYEKLKEMRQAKNVSVETLSDLLGLETKNAYYKKEAGRIKFSLKDALILSKFFGVSVEDLFSEDEIEKASA